MTSPVGIDDPNVYSNWGGSEEGSKTLSSLHTVSDSPNRLLIAQIHTHDDRLSRYVTTIRWNSVNLAQEYSKAFDDGYDEHRIQVYYLVDPDPGELEFYVAFNSPCNWAVGLHSFYNVDQDAIWRAQTDSGLFIARNFSDDVVSEESDLVIDAFIAHKPGTTLATPAAGQAEQLNYYSGRGGTGPDDCECGFSTKPAVGTITSMGWTDGGDRSFHWGRALIPKLATTGRGYLVG